MNVGITTLQNRPEMLARLLRVSSDSNLERKLYPIFLAKAGEQRVARGVAVTVALAVYEFGKHIPQNETNLALRFSEKFVDAIVCDAKITAEAKAHLKEILKFPVRTKMTLA